MAPKRGEDNAMPEVPFLSRMRCASHGVCAETAILKENFLHFSCGSGAISSSRRNSRARRFDRRAALFPDLRRLAHRFVRPWPLL